MECVVSVGMCRGSGRLNHVSMIGTWTVVDCLVSVGLVMDINVLCRINRTGTRPALYYIVYA